MANNRLKALGLIGSRLKGLIYTLKTYGIKAAYNYLWVHAFTRDSGMALMDPVLRKLPFLATYPKTIEMEVTTRCHLKCTMCEHTYWHEPNHDMSLAEFQRIVDQFPKLKWLGITGIGSNLLNRDFFPMLRYVKSKKVYVEFFDTFDLINEDNAAELIKAGVNKIWMSIDGATAATYEKIRVGTNFDKVTGNARRLMELKKDFKTPFPEVWFHYIISADNYKEVPQFVRLVREITSPGTNLATMIYFSNLLCFDEVKDMAVAFPDELRTEAERTAREAGIFVGWNQNLKPTRCVNFCTRWTEPFILATGHVQACCAINEANTRQYQKDHALANLIETDFHDVWNTGYKKLMQDIHANRLPEICKHCRNFIHD